MRWPSFTGRHNPLERWHAHPFALLPVEIDGWWFWLDTGRKPSGGPGNAREMPPVR